MKIICPIHGEFWQTPYTHLNGSGCANCSKTKQHTIEEVIKKCNEIHNKKYDYSLITEYKNNKTKLPIVCHKKDENGNEHGIFYSSFHNHVHHKHGCPKCNGGVNYTFEIFLEKFIKKHGNKYSYDKNTYVNNTTPLKIVCPIHGEFWQTPQNHANGCNCPSCNNSHLEEEIMLYLIENKIEFIQQYKFEWLFNEETNKKLKLDFYLPKYNVAIECQGIQHFMEGHWESLKKITTRDERKRKLCEEHGVKLLYYSNLGIEYPYKVYEDKEELIENIKKC